MITILGGGISGLTCAYELHKHNIPFRLLEASNRVGGLIQSKKVDGYLLEFGANSTFNEEALSSLCKEIGLQPITAKPVSKNRFVYKNNKINTLPSGPLSFISCSFFSWKAKLAILKEYKHKPQHAIQNESVSDFFLRHFNQEIVDYAVDPFVSGIYANSPDTLSIEECFPKLVEYEKEYGSIIKGFAKNKTKGKRREIISFKNGLQELPNAIHKHIHEHVQLNTEVKSISKQGENWAIETENNSYESKYIINCLPPHITSKLFSSIHSEFSNAVAAIQSPTIAMVHTVFDKQDFEKELNGFGCLIPSKERNVIAGSIWSSSIFENRCSENEVLLTNIVTNNTQNILASDDKTLSNAVISDLQKIFNLNKVRPKFTNIYRYKKSIPQYDASISKTRTFLPNLESQNIFTATNWSKEVSVVGSVKNSLEVSKKIISLYS